MKRVLITFAGGHHALGITEALKAAPEPIHIIGADSSPYHLHQANTDEIHLIPRADDPDFVPILSRLAEGTGADYVWPVHDDEVLRVAESPGQMAVRTWTPPSSVLLTSRDKMATYLAMQAADVPSPRTFAIDSYADLKRAFSSLGGDVWLRATQGASGKGAFRTDNLQHAKYWIEINDGWGRFMCAEVLPGELNHSWESIWRNGRLVAAQTETELVHDSPGISVKGVKSRGVQLRDAPAGTREAAELAVRAIMPRPNGLFRVDMRADSTGKPCVTEVDAGRFGSGGTVDWYWSGYNWAYEALRLGMGEPIRHRTPVIDPSPKDRVAIGGINRKKVFVMLADVDAKAAEYEARLKTRTMAER